MPNEAKRAPDPDCPYFQLDIVPDRERVIVVPAGEIDLASAPQIEQAIDDLLERGFRRVVVDLRRVDFLDSQGVRALVNAHHRAREQDATLALVLGQGPPRSVLEMCGVLAHIEVDG